MGSFNIVGHISVIVGCMFSGKTTELQSRIAHYKKEGFNVLSFTKDTRFGKNKIVSHEGDEIEATSVASAEEIKNYVNDATDVVAIDEGQFFGVELIKICHELAMAGKAVMVAGLDQNYKTEPFETMTRLMAEAEVITKIIATCECETPAIRNFRKTSNEEVILEGCEDIYEAMCRRCYAKRLST